MESASWQRPLYGFKINQKQAKTPLKSGFSDGLGGAFLSMEDRMKFLCRLLMDILLVMVILMHQLVHCLSRKMIMNSPCRPLKMTSRSSYAMRRTQWSTPLMLLREQQRLSFPLRSQAVLNFASFPSLLPIIIGDILICDFEM